MENLAPYVKQILNLAKFINSHLLATEEEREEAIGARREVISSSNLSPQRVFSLLQNLSTIKEELIKRETGIRLQKKEIKAYGNTLENVEERLVQSISRGKSFLSKVTWLLLVLLVLVIIGVLVEAYFIISAPLQSFSTVLAKSVTLSIVIIALYFLARVYQVSYESSERMQEKIVAIRFLTYGMRLALTEKEQRFANLMIENAVAMFLGSPRVSQPLGNEDLMALMKGLAAFGQSLGSKEIE